MPELDASFDVLMDPVIAATRFVVVRRRSWTDRNGIAQKSEERASALGSVTSVESDLERLDDSQSQTKVLLVITKFFLRAAAQDSDGVQWQPDLVLWQGNYYLVHSIEDFSQFGGGFVAAKCPSFDYVPNPPIGSPPSVSIGRLDLRQRNNSGLLGALR